MPTYHKCVKAYSHKHYGPPLSITKLALQLGHLGWHPFPESKNGWHGFKLWDIWTFLGNIRSPSFETKPFRDTVWTLNFEKSTSVDHRLLWQLHNLFVDICILQVWNVSKCDMFPSLGAGSSIRLPRPQLYLTVSFTMGFNRKLQTSSKETKRLKCDFLKIRTENYNFIIIIDRYTSIINVWSHHFQFKFPYLLDLKMQPETHLIIHDWSMMPNSRSFNFHYGRPYHLNIPDFVMTLLPYSLSTFKMCGNRHRTSQNIVVRNGSDNRCE